MKYPFIVIVVIIILLGGGYVLTHKNASKPKEEAKVESPAEKLRGKTFNLSGQGLTKVPADVFQNTQLNELDLSNNKLDGALPSQVGQLINLRTLNLSGNKFTGVPAEIGQLTNLETLDLSNNELTGLPHELGNLHKLKFLDISGNKYSESDLEIIKKNLPITTIIKSENQ